MTSNYLMTASNDIQLYKQITTFKRVDKNVSAAALVVLQRPGQYRKKNVVYLGEKCSGFYQPKGDFSSL